MEAALSAILIVAFFVVAIAYVSRGKAP